MIDRVMSQTGYPGFFIRCEQSKMSRKNMQEHITLKYPPRRLEKKLSVARPMEIFDLQLFRHLQIKNGTHLDVNQPKQHRLRPNPQILPVYTQRWC